MQKRRRRFDPEKGKVGEKIQSEERSDILTRTDGEKRGSEGATMLVTIINDRLDPPIPCNDIDTNYDYTMYKQKISACA